MTETRFPDCREWHYQVRARIITAEPSANERQLKVVFEVINPDWKALGKFDDLAVAINCAMRLNSECHGKEPAEVAG